MNRKRRAGFTLIELLVVVAIIAMLISILLPSLSRARESSRTIKCLANMRSIGLGIIMFANDNDNVLLPAMNRELYEQSPRPSDYTWQGQLYPYLGLDTDNFSLSMVRISGYADYGDGLFLCPTTLTKKVPTPLATKTESGDYCYGLNILPAYYRYYADNLQSIYKHYNSTPVPLGRIKDPSGTNFMMEVSYWWGSRSYYTNNYGLMPHSEKSNFLYGDGHAGTLAYDAVPNDSNGNNFWSGGLDD